MGRDQLVSIQVPDIEKIKARLGSLESKAPGILSKSINATVRQLSTIMVKEAQKKYWIKATAAKKTFTIIKSRPSSLSGEVVSKADNRVRLFGFKVSPQSPTLNTGTEVKVQVKKGSGMKVLKGDATHSPAFIATMANGLHTGIFQRQTNKVGTSRKTDRIQSRLVSKFRNMPDNPISELTGPPFPALLSSGYLSKEITVQGSRLMQEVLNKEIKRALEAKK